MNTVFAALIVLCLGIFTSISIGAVSHILMVLAIIFFLISKPSAFLSDLFEKKHLAYSSIAFIVAIILSVLFNWNDIERPLKNISKIKYFLIPLLSIPLLKMFFKEKMDNKKIKILVYLFLLATTVATISGLIGLYTGHNPLKFKAACHPTRACGLYGMYMSYGYGIAFFMIIISGLLLYSRKVFSPVALGFSWLVNFAGMILSYARGGWLGFFLAAPFFFFKKSPKKFLVGSTLIILTVGSTIYFTPSLHHRFIEARQDSNNQRLAFFETAYVAFKERPIFGWGYKNFEPNVKELKKKYKIAYPDYGADAHNILLEVLASTGIVGFICFMYFLLAWLIEAYKGSSIIHKISFPFVVSVGISGQVQNVFGDGENLFLIMLIWSILAAFPGERRIA